VSTEACSVRSALAQADADRHAAGLIQAGYLAFVPSAAMAQTIVESSLAVLDAAPGRSARAA